MKALVTGNAGFIGSHLADRLLKVQGLQVFGLDNFSTGKFENIHKEVTQFTRDIRHLGELDEVFEMHQFDYVFHLAAMASIAPSIDDPVKSNAVNLTGTLNVLECCRKHHVRKIIFASSSAIYSSEVKLPTNEKQLTDPLNPYALQKLLSEQYIYMYRKLYGLNYSVARFFNVYGTRQPTTGAYAPVIGIFLRQAKEGKALTIFGDGSKRRDFTHVSDTVEALIKLMELNKAITVNVGTGVNFSIKQIADAISKDQVTLPNKEGELQESKADCTFIKAITGWEAKIILSKKVIKQLVKDLK